MAIYSYDRYTSTGQASFAITFDYLSSTHIEIYLDGVLQSTGYSIDTGTNQVTFTSAPGSGVVVLAQRVTPKTKADYQAQIADFANGSVLSESDLDNAVLGLLYISQEAEDSGATNAISKDLADNLWDAESIRIKNVGTPTGSADAVTKTYVDGLALYNSPVVPQLYSFTATASQTAFTLDPAPTSTDVQSFIVDLDGVVQKPTTDFTVSGSTLTLTSGASLAQVLTVRNIGIARDILGDSPTVTGDLTVTGAISGTMSSGNVTSTGSTTARSLATRFADVVNVKDYGAVGDGSTDDTTAIQAAITAAETNNSGKIFYPVGSYLVTNFHKKVGVTHYGDAASWKIGSTTYPIPINESETVADYTVYVDSGSGSDTANCGLTAGTAYQTLQYAWDSIPTIVKHYGIIQLADGTYNTSTIAAGDQPRPAVLWGKGKVTALRSYHSGDNIIGGITLRGNASDNTAVKIETGASYTYGVYINKGTIGLQDLTIQGDNTNNAQTLLVSHRTDTHVYTKNVILDGRDVAKTVYGAYCESNGQIEFVEGASGIIKNCATGGATLTSGDNLTIVSNGGTMITGCTDGVKAFKNSYVGLMSLQDGDGKVEIIDDTCTTGIYAYEDAIVEVRGEDATTDMAQIASPILIEQAFLNLIYAETTDTVTVKMGRVKYNASNYQKNILAYASDIHLEQSNSYVSPATANTDTKPIQLMEDSRLYKESTNNINGAGGTYTFPTDVPIEQSFTADDEGYTLLDGRNILELQSNSGNHWVDCYIDSSGIREGRIIHIWGGESTDGVTLSNSSGDMDLANAITIGNAVGEYRGATFIMVNSKWRLTALGQKRV